MWVRAYWEWVWWGVLCREARHGCAMDAACVLSHWPRTTAAQAALRMQSHVLCCWPTMQSGRAFIHMSSGVLFCWCVRAALGIVRASCGGFKRLGGQLATAASLLNVTRLVFVLLCRVISHCCSCQHQGCSAAADVCVGFCVCALGWGAPCVGRSVCAAGVCFTGLCSLCSRSYRLWQGHLCKAGRLSTCSGCAGAPGCVVFGCCVSSPAPCGPVSPASVPACLCAGCAFPCCCYVGPPVCRRSFVGATVSQLCGCCSMMDLWGACLLCVALSDSFFMLQEYILSASRVCAAYAAAAWYPLCPVKSNRKAGQIHVSPASFCHAWRCAAMLMMQAQYPYYNLLPTGRVVPLLGTCKLPCRLQL